MWRPVINRPWWIVLSSSLLLIIPISAEKAPTVSPLTPSLIASNLYSGSLLKTTAYSVAGIALLTLSAILSRRFYYWFTKPKPPTLTEQIEKLRKAGAPNHTVSLKLQQQVEQLLLPASTDPNSASLILSPRSDAYASILRKIVPLFEKNCFECTKTNQLCSLTLYPEREVTGAQRFEFLITRDECLQVTVMEYEQRTGFPFTDDGDFNDTQSDCSIYRECGRYPPENAYAIYLQAANALIQTKKIVTAPQIP